jgi:DNA-binding NarL/FixJ family response regulator
MKKGKGVLADNHQNMLAGVRTILENMFEKVFMVADEASLLKVAEKMGPDLIVQTCLSRSRGRNRSYKKRTEIPFTDG